MRIAEKVSVATRASNEAAAANLRTNRAQRVGTASPHHKPEILQIDAEH